jgi:selenocysteine lyase/cysteine desulfurase
MINEETLIQHLDKSPFASNKLFAFPAQSNVSGVKHDMKWIEYAQQRGWDVLLDAAAFVPSSRLDLSIYQPDFVCVSFYKIFGYPTGIGCLLIKNSTYSKLVKPWFAGGTVTLVSVVSQEKFLTSGHERFEDGTLNYTNLPAITYGLDYIESIGIDRINQRVKSQYHSTPSPFIL